MGQRAREHREVLGAGMILFFLAEGGGAVGQGDDVVALLVSDPHGGFDAAVGEETAQRDVGDAARTQHPVQIGAFEAAQTALAFNNDVAGFGLERIHDLRTPAALHEGLGVLDALEDAIGFGAHFAVTVGEGDRHPNDGGASGASFFHRLDGVG